MAPGSSRVSLKLSSGCWPGLILSLSVQLNCSFTMQPWLTCSYYSSLLFSKGESGAFSPSPSTAAGVGKPGNSRLSERRECHLVATRSGTRAQVLCPSISQLHRQATGPCYCHSTSQGILVAQVAVATAGSTQVAAGHHGISHLAGQAYTEDGVTKGQKSPRGLRVQLGCS